MARWQHLRVERRLVQNGPHVTRGVVPRHETAVGIAFLYDVLAMIDGRIRKIGVL